MDTTAQSFKILAVDDNHTNIKVIGSILRDAGYQVGFAMNGRQAIEVLEEVDDFDLVLMDINMPEIDGFEALQIIKGSENTQHIPVIMLTAYNNTETVVKGFDLGAVDYITKPFNSKELLSRVNTQLQLKRKTDLLKEHSIQLELMNITKDKFFSIISHDLRNPMGALKVISNLLKSSIAQNNPEQTQEMLVLLDSTINNGFKLLDNLLEWARSQTGRIKVNIIELYLVAVADEVIEAIAAVGKNIKLHNNISESQTIFADNNLLKTILRNLLANAVKYCNPKDGEIFVDAEESDNIVTIRIKDNGIGMDVETINRLFRIDGNVTSMPGTLGEEGTGLGLILCKEFADKMGGEIFVESKPNVGSTFILAFPAREAQPVPH